VADPKSMTILFEVIGDIMPSRMDFILKAVYKKKYNFRAML